MTQRGRDVLFLVDPSLLGSRSMYGDASRSVTLLVARDQASKLQGSPPDRSLLPHAVQLLLAPCTAGILVRQGLRPCHTPPHGSMQHVVAGGRAHH